MEFIGRPYDETSGTIREAMVNYAPFQHDPIERAIEAMPHVKFVMFEGYSEEEVTEMYEKKMADYFRPENYPILEIWKNIMATGDLAALQSFYEDIINSRVRMDFDEKTDTPQYKNVTSFLETAALTHFRHNYATTHSAGKTSSQLKAKFGDRVEVVAVDSLINQWARDCIFSLDGGGQKIIMPSTKYAGNGGIIGQLDIDNRIIANNEVWDRRGYKRNGSLNIKGFVGGQITANKGHAFIGMNAFEPTLISLKSIEGYLHDIEAGKGKPDIASLLGSLNPEVKKELERITARMEVHEFVDGKNYEHIDVLAMPADSDTVYIGDVSRTYSLLKKRNLVTGHDINTMKPYAMLLGNIKKCMEASGLKTIPVPFWAAKYEAGQYMFTYCNTLQEDGRIYTPRHDEHKYIRLGRIGKVLDEDFSRTVSGRKDVVWIPNFNAPGYWSSAGLRCLVNVLYRE